MSRRDVLNSERAGSGPCVLTFFSRQGAGTARWAAASTGRKCFHQLQLRGFASECINAIQQYLPKLTLGAVAACRERDLGSHAVDNGGARDDVKGDALVDGELGGGLNLMLLVRVTGCRRENTRGSQIYQHV